MISTVAILAGGLATRLHPVTQTTPKSLIEVGGEPFIAHQLRLLSRNGIQQVVLCIGYLGEMIEQVIGSGRAFGLNVSYSYDGPQLLGTGGAIRKALPVLSDPFFLLYGDSYLECDYPAIGAAFEKCGKQGMMTVFHNENRWDESNVEFCEGNILAYNKLNRTSRMHHIDYGLGVFQKSVFESDLDAPFSLAEVYQALLQQQQLAAYEVFHRFYEIGSRDGLEETRAHFRLRNKP